MEERDSDNIKKLLLEYITGATKNFFNGLYQKISCLKTGKNVSCLLKILKKNGSKSAGVHSVKKQSVGNVFSVMLPYFCYLYVSVCFY